jgi:hypothetical protein
VEGLPLLRASLLLVAGVLATLPLIAWARRRSPRYQVKIYALGIAVAALIYLGFALSRGGAERLAAEVAGREAAALLAYGGIAILAARGRALLAALGWAAHSAWDLMHLSAATAYVPSWYPSVCIGFDLALAVYIAVACGRRPAA